MKKFTTFSLAITAVIAGSCSQTLWAETSANTNSNDKLKMLLAPISTLNGSFQQTVKSEKGNVLQRLSGKFWIKKPAQFRWEIQGKEPRLVIADGKKIFDFDKELDQVTVQKLDKGQTHAPIYFLTGDASSIDKDFQVKIFTSKDKKNQVQTLATEASTCMQGSDACFELKPKRTEGSFQWIRIGFRNKNLQEMEMLDQLGQYSQFVFKDVVLNANISAKQFQFTPPAGVDILKND